MLSKGQFSCLFNKKKVDLAKTTLNLKSSSHIGRYVDRDSEETVVLTQMKLNM